MPLNRNLFHRNTKHLGEQQNLDVKDPGRQVLTGEDLLRSFSSEELEPALCVTDVTNTEHAEDSVETVHQQVSEEGTL
jgi:hypothetical protein